MWKGCRFAARNSECCAGEIGLRAEFIGSFGASDLKRRNFFIFYLRGSKRVVYLHP
ncbi:MAG: hypothetical protein ACI8VZ_001205, partial [Candidatus Paceibacteria bacterium]